MSHIPKTSGVQLRLASIEERTTQRSQKGGNKQLASLLTFGIIIAFSDYEKQKISMSLWRRIGFCTWRAKDKTSFQECQGVLV
jgi:hypothetical protein